MASYLVLSLAAKSSNFFLLVSLAHLAPSSLPTSGTANPGLAFITAGRSSLAKNMNADSPLLGALGSFLAFFFFSGFSTLPLATFFRGEALALAGDFAAFLAGAAFFAGAFLAGDLAGAFLAGAFLTGVFSAAFLAAAFLAGAFFATLGILQQKSLTSTHLNTTPLDDLSRNNNST